MTEETGSFAGVGGRRIFCHSWAPEGFARGVIVLVHGAGEHSGRYGHVVARLVAEGYAVHACDHRGHGRSDGPRALIEDMDDVVADVDSLVDRAVASHPGEPAFMLGHSMGGLIALRYAIAHQERLTGLDPVGGAGSDRVGPQAAGAGGARAVARRPTHAADRHRPIARQPRPCCGAGLRL